MTKYLHFNQSHYNLAAMSQKQRKMYQSRTVAIAPVPAELIRNLAIGMAATDKTPFLTITVGISRVNVLDRYEKRIGREVATGKMKDVQVNVEGVTVTPTHIFVKLSPLDGVNLTLRLNRSTNFSTVVGHV